MRESLGAALLMAGKPADADAAWIEREFEEAWRDADTKLAIDGL
jgi:hypothetical protein